MFLLPTILSEKKKQLHLHVIHRLGKKGKIRLMAFMFQRAVAAFIKISLVTQSSFAIMADKLHVVY